MSAWEQDELFLAWIDSVALRLEVEREVLLHQLRPVVGEWFKPDFRTGMCLRCGHPAGEHSRSVCLRCVCPGWVQPVKKGRPGRKPGD